MSSCFACVLCLLPSMTCFWRGTTLAWHDGDTTTSWKDSPNVYREKESCNKLFLLQEVKKWASLLLLLDCHFIFFTECMMAFATPAKLYVRRSCQSLKEDHPYMLNILKSKYHAAIMWSGNLFSVATAVVGHHPISITQRESGFALIDHSKEPHFVTFMACPLSQDYMYKLFKW